jgi:DNA topoisomerase-1
VRLENRRFYAEKMGEIVTERLQSSFSDLLDYGFTAGMEEHLDEVAGGPLDWRSLLDDFYADFKQKLERAGCRSPTACRPTRRR